MKSVCDMDPFSLLQKATLQSALRPPLHSQLPFLPFDELLANTFRSDRMNRLRLNDLDLSRMFS